MKCLETFNLGSVLSTLKVSISGAKRWKYSPFQPVLKHAPGNLERNSGARRGALAQQNDAAERQPGEKKLEKKFWRFVSPVSGLLLFTTLLPVPPLSAIQPVSAAESGDRSSLRQNDVYAPLRAALNARDWRAGDRETRRLLERWMPPGSDLFSTPPVSRVPAEVWQTLDRLWLDASDRRFGFSVQQRLWQQSQARHPNDRAAAVRDFGRQVGWLRPVPDGNNFVAPEWFTEPELSNSPTVPVGYFPWGGVSWERIENMLNQQSCGSCMIDAMDLQGDRFHRYLPALYEQVQIALNTSTAPQTWDHPQLRFQIDLNSLYPNNRCPVRTLAQEISPNSQILAVSSYSYERACGGGASNSTLVLWNAQRGNRIVTLVRGQAMEAFSAGGQPQEPPTEQDRIVGEVANAIAFTPDSQHIAAGMTDGTVRLWSATTGQRTRTLSGHRYAVRAIALSADGRQLVSAGADQTLKLWNLQTGQLVRTLVLQPGDGQVHTVKISPDGTRVAIATSHNSLQLWDLTNGQRIRTLVDQTVNQADLLPIAFSPDGRFLVTGDTDHSVKLWNPATGTRLLTLRGHRAPLRSFTFTPNRQTLASSSSDYTVHLWDLSTRQLQRTLNGATGITGERPQSPGGLSFSADGRTLSSSALLTVAHPVSGEPLAQPGLRLWDVATGQPINQVLHVHGFAFSPNGQFLLTNGYTLQVWQPGSRP